MARRDTADQRRARVLRVISASGMPSGWWSSVTGVQRQRLVRWLRLRDYPDEFEAEVALYAAADPEMAQVIALLPSPTRNEIEALRERLDLSPDDFAAALGVGRTTYYKWLRGSVMHPNRQRWFHWISRLGPGALARREDH